MDPQSSPPSSLLPQLKKIYEHILQSLPEDEFLSVSNELEEATCDMMWHYLVYTAPLSIQEKLTSSDEAVVQKTALELIAQSTQDPSVKKELFILLSDFLTSCDTELEKQYTP